MSEATPSREGRKRPSKRKGSCGRLDNHADQLHASRHPAHPLPTDVGRSLQAALAALFPGTGLLLDLMSGVNCYLPLHQQIVGLDIDQEGLTHNSVLAARVVSDLNITPVLPFATAIFSGAVCVSGVQYLTSPVTIFREIHRVLNPGAPFLVAYTDYFFPAKAVAVWSILHAPQRAALVASHFREAGGWSTPNKNTLDGFVHLVWAYKSRNSPS